MTVALSVGVVPALDLIGGKVVRLYQGDYQKSRAYSDDPLAILGAYAQAGARFVHLVDLDGAKDPKAAQRALFLDLLARLKDLGVKAQVGGGARSFERASAWLKGGAARVAIGSMAIDDPKQTRRIFEEFGGDKVALALDVRIQDGKKYVATAGWQRQSGALLEETIESYIPYGLRHVLCTDIGKDGTLLGTNLALYRQVCSAYPEVAFLASGGVGSLDDIAALKDTGVAGVVVGRALLEGKFGVQEALACLQNV